MKIYIVRAFYLQDELFISRIVLIITLSGYSILDTKAWQSRFPLSLVVTIPDNVSRFGKVPFSLAPKGHDKY